MFEPQILSDKLAIVEASRSLAEASATLSIAARAMSRAAACLEAMGGGGCKEYVFGARTSTKFEDWVASPDWAQNSYDLSQISVSKDANEVGQGYKHTSEQEIVSNSDINNSKTEEECLNALKPIQASNGNPCSSTPFLNKSEAPSQSNLTAETRQATVPSQSAPAAPSDTRHSMAPPELIPPGPSTPPKTRVNLPKYNHNPKPDTQTTTSATSTPAPKPTITTVPRVPATKPAFIETKPRLLPTKPAIPPTQPRPPIAKATTPAPNTRVGQSAGSSAPAPGEANCAKVGPLSGPSRIVLDRGFDSLPALCHVTKRFAKTVCIYNYSGLTATLSSAVMVKANVKTDVIVPQSTKKDKLNEAVSKFNLAQSGILLWPGCTTLPAITGLVDSPNIQLIQLGQPTKANSDLTCSNLTFILANSKMDQQPLAVKQYRLDPLSDECNKQGTKSPLQPSRIWLRFRLSNDSFARGFYWDWFLVHRRRNHHQKVTDVLKLANEYAEQFLLRGESKVYGEPIGGKVTITGATVKNLKLEEAVKIGLLLVAQS
ncbi:hypothetical protein RSOLAG1IB_12204 [Rhizoctonia solani AG-1 IB]|nr:hypothetical protein RSOLAG1IB_12204 [Rhizoctonia solani AG-1 IB]